MIGHQSLKSQLRRRKVRGQRGVVFLLALVALLLISAIGAAILYMAAAESGLVGNQRMSAQAYYAGVSGLEEGRYRLLPGSQAATLVGAVPLGLNYTEPSGVAVAGPAGIPIMPCTPSALVFPSPFPIPAEEPGTLVPCNTASVPVFGGRRYEALYIVNSAAANPAAPGNDPAQPPAADNDPFIAGEISPAATVATTGSIQPRAGAGGSVPWEWVRINLKTERASGTDVDLDGSINDDQPIFLFNNRQYKLNDLVAFDATRAILPPPWGPPFDPVIGKPCLSTGVCATPVYMLTSYATIPGRNPAHRLVRSEVAAATALGINASILSDPAVTIQGQSEYIGYDGCDPDCPAGNPPYAPGAWPGAPCAPPPNCNFAVPVQSQDDPGNPPPDDNNSQINGNTTETYPCPPDPNACPPPSTVQGDSCIQQNAEFPYNIDELIAQYHSTADTILEGGPAAFTGPTLTASGVLGQFPAGDVNQGAGAVTKIVYVDGDFTCSGACRGAGVLVVDGDFQFTGGFEWWGAIIVRGDSTAVGGGGASPASGCNIYGAMLVGGTAALGTTVGGSLCFRYNSCAQRDIFRNRPFQRLSFREIPY